MNHAKLMQSIKKQLPLIFSIVASAGVIATTAVALKVKPKKPPEDLNPKAKAVVYLKTYGPTIALATSTIACIFGSYAVSRKHQAAIASAYTMLYTSYNEYKEKVKELYGEEAHNAVMDAIVKEKCKDVSLTACGFTNSSLSIDDEFEPEVVRTFYEPISERYFESTLSKVIEAEYHLNRNFVLGATIALNDFYEFLGLSTTEYGETVGWYLDDGLYWIDFDHRMVQLEDSPNGMNVCVIYPVFDPRLPTEYDI